MFRIQKFFILSSFLCFSCHLLVPLPLHAQRKSSKGNETPDLMEMLKREEVRKALEISEKHQEQIRQLEKDSKIDLLPLTSLYRKLKSAKTDGEKDRIKKEMNEVRQKVQQKQNDELKKILPDEKYAKLLSLSRKSRDLNLLSQTKIQDRLKLDLKQRGDIKKYLEQRKIALDNLGVDAAADQVQQVESFWNGRILAKLSSEQKVEWEKIVAEQPDRKPSTNSSATSNQNSSVVPLQPKTPADQVVASFAVEEGTEKATNSVTQTPANPRTTPNTSPPAQSQIPTSNTKPESRFLSFNFHGAAWPDVLKLFAKSFRTDT